MTYKESTKEVNYYIDGELDSTVIAPTVVMTLPTNARLFARVGGTTGTKQLSDSVLSTSGTLVGALSSDDIQNLYQMTGGRDKTLVQSTAYYDFKGNADDFHGNYDFNTVKDEKERSELHSSLSKDLSSRFNTVYSSGRYKKLNFNIDTDPSGDNDEPYNLNQKR
jgi:hypothetical protein